MSFSHIKKVELHTHLDCSLSYDLVKKNLPEINIKIMIVNSKNKLSISIYIKLIIF